MSTSLSKEMSNETKPDRLVRKLMLVTTSSARFKVVREVSCASGVKLVTRLLLRSRFWRLVKFVREVISVIEVPLRFRNRKPVNDPRPAVLVSGLKLRSKLARLRFISDMSERMA